MLATVMYAAQDVRVENVPDATLVEPTDALVRVTRACICGSDLWPYRDMPRSESGQSMGHEAIGVVEAVGREVSRIRVGDTVIMPFAYSDGRCDLVSLRRRSVRAIAAMIATSRMQPATCSGYRYCV